ncbi:pitrilysin family protein [Duganella sp. HH101]|uniref:M16 family metallopeptidase n=1 Tax=Duganella sp. HH101 TaxID=1781066 RepID=UPI0008738C71|nr:pitrilysin family protein [Duganella sp. HH101]OFA04886.1 peptidase M16 inactive domain protein [Duganella sp. HH101]
MKRTLRVSLLAALVASAFNPAGAAPAAAPKAAVVDLKPYTIPYQKFTLQNGLTLIVHEDHSVPLVSVNVWYHVGSRNEKRGKTGFAHLFEHFFFNGSENYPHGFREAMDDLGASSRNGTTSNDRTNFYEDVPVSALDRTLYLEADRMGFLANYINKEMLERERGVVQNEKRQGENQPYGRVHIEEAQRMYPASHPYSWPVIGYMEDLNAASLDDIKEWYRTYYGPNNAVLVLAGDIKPEQALATVKKYFDGIPPGPPLVRTNSWIPTLDRDIRDEMEDQVAQVRIQRSYHAPVWGDPETLRLSILAEVLTGSKSARLTKRLVYDKALATSVSARADGNELAGTFAIRATLKQGVDVAVVEREIDAVVDELLAQGPTAEELARVRTKFFADAARQIERLGGGGGRSGLLAENMMFGGSPDAYLNDLRALAAAQPADVKATSNKWLHGAHHYTMVVKPFPKLAAGKTAIDRKVLPPLGEAPAVSFPAMQRARLANGLNVVLIERHGAPIVNAALSVDAGAASDSAAKSGLASLALELLDKGTKTRDAFQLSNALETQGAQLGTTTQADRTLVRLQSTAANFGASLDLMADAVLNASFPAEQFKLQKQRRIAQIAQEKSSPAGSAQRVMGGLLYGADNAYGKPVSGDDKTVEALTRDDLVNWHRDWFKPGSSTLVVTGDTTMAKLMPMLEASFGKWAAGSAPVKPSAAAPATQGKRVYLIDRPDAPQSMIVAAHVSLPHGQPEDLAMEPVMQNFGGMSTSRLNRNLRLDKHWSYGTTAGLTNVRGQRAFTVMAPVQTDKTKEAMLEVAKEIKGVAGERPLAGEEYASIMRNMTSRLPARFESIDALENAALQSVNLRLPDDYWTNYASRISALTQAQLADAAPKYIHPEQVVWLVVGDVRKIEAGVRELGWGEVIKLDANGQPLK